MGQTSIRGWPDPGRGPYRLELHLAEVEGRVELVGLLVGHLPDYPSDSAPVYGPLLPITGTLLRQLPVATLLDEAIDRSGLEETLTEWASSEPEEWLEEYRHIPADAAEALAALRARQTEQRPGRPSKPPEHYLEVSEVYRKAHEGRKPPTKAVQEHFKISYTSAAKKVAKARRLGFLPPTTRGKASS